MSWADIIEISEAQLAPSIEAAKAESTGSILEKLVKKKKEEYQDIEIAKMNELMKDAHAENLKKQKKWGFLNILKPFSNFVPGLRGITTLLDAYSKYEGAKGQKDMLEKVAKDKSLRDVGFLKEGITDFRKKTTDLAEEIKPWETGLTSLAKSAAGAAISGAIGDKVKGMFTGQDITPGEITPGKAIPSTSAEIGPLTEFDAAKPLLEQGVKYGPDIVGEDIITEGFFKGEGGPLKNLLANIESEKWGSGEGFLGGLKESTKEGIDEWSDINVQLLPLIQSLISKDDDEGGSYDASVHFPSIYRR